MLKIKLFSGEPAQIETDFIKWYSDSYVIKDIRLSCAISAFVTQNRIPAIALPQAQVGGLQFTSVLVLYDDKTTNPLITEMEKQIVGQKL